MRIGIDVYGLSKTKLFTGINNYLRNILKQLESLDQENEYFLYNDKDIKFTCSNPRWQKRISSDFFGGIHTAWLNTVLVNNLLRDEIDLFWQPNGALLPIFIPKKIKVLLTVHDLVSHYYPETMELCNRFVSRVLFRSSIRKADSIIAISNSTANSIKDFLGNAMDREKIHVVNLSVGNEKLSSINETISKLYIKDKFGIESDYVLFVGTLEPRKNLLSLLRAFSLLVKNYGKLKLVIVGKTGWGKSGINVLLKQSGLDAIHVKYLGYVQEDDLGYLYSAAKVFAMPSIYEGFGIPILEAMTCGCPVITSNVSSLPEVAGDAAFLINPYNVEEIAAALYKVISDNILRENMKIKGFGNTKRFSWENTAKQTLKLINSI